MKSLNHQTICERLTLFYSLVHYLDKSSTTLVVDAPNSVIEQVLNWQDCNYKRLTSKALIERYGLWVEPNSLSSVKLLATDSGVVEYCGAIQAGLASVPPPRARLRCDSLDRSFGHLKKLGLFYLNEVGIPEILSGALQTIKKQRPVVVIPRGRVAKAFLDEWSQSHKYHVFDLFLTPYDYVLVPDELAWLEQACKSAMLGGELDPLGLPPEVSMSSGLSTEQVLSALVNRAYNGLSSTLESQSFRLKLRTQWAQRGWYEGEGDDSFAWRWSGPEYDSVILLPVPAPGKYQLVMRLLYFVDDKLDGVGQLFINGKHIIQLAKGAANEPLKLIFDMPEEGFDGYAEVQFSLPETIQPSEYDLRRLGVALGEIAVSWEGEL